MRKTQIGKGASGIAILALFGVGAQPALAQTSPAGESVKNEEVVVTATRRDQALQDTPLAVTAINAEQIQRANIVSTQDLQRVAPTLMIQNSNSETGGSTIRIRGVGTTGNNPGLEGAVGVFIDGVYRQRSGLAMNNLFDVKGIEVLRGPQGTLFGKNTSAGAITVRLNTPELGEFGGYAKAGVGNFASTDFEGAVNIPLGEKFAARVAGAYQKRDGYVDDVRTGRDSFNRDRQLVRGMLLWEPTNNISWRITADYSQKDEDCCQAVYKIAAPVSFLQAGLVGVTALPLDVTRYQSINSTNRPFVETTEDKGIASHLTIDFGGATLKSVISHREFSAQNDVDADFGPADILYQKISTDQTLDSYELTLNGKANKIDWLIGAYYADETADIINATPYGADLQRFITLATLGSINSATAAALYPTNGGAVRSVFGQNGSSWSIFTHEQIQFTDKFGMVIGVRLNNERKGGGMSQYITNSPSCGGGPFNGQGAAPPAGVPATLRLLCPRPTYYTTIDEQESTGTFGFNYKFDDDIFGYVSYSHGYKAGGINLDRDAPAAAGINPASGLVTGTQAQVNAAAGFAPEFSDSYEVGVRSQFFNRTLTVNLTYFKTDYQDFQLNTFNGLGFTISNAGSVNSHGFEVETNWRVRRDLFLNLGVAQTVAKYGNEAVLRQDPVDQLPAPNQDLPLAGRTLTNAPKWNISSGVHYEHPVLFEGVKGFFDISANYRSHYNTGSDLVLAKEQPAFTTINGRIGLFQDTDKGWEVAVWGTNITNEYSQLINFDTVFQAGSLSEFPAPPRMYGVTVRKSF